MSSSLGRRFTRRDALEFLGSCAGFAVLSNDASGQSLTLPKGAIIRTVLKDYAPDSLGDGAVLFHEHLQLTTDFGARFATATAAARAANGLPPIPPRPAGNTAGTGPDIMHNVDLMTEEVLKAKNAGIACIVDAGHADTGRDINFIRQVSLRSGLPIVPGGGFYSQPWYLIAAYQQLISRAHARGVKLIGCTLMPFEGVDISGYYSPAKDATRQAVNKWIRTSHAFDGVIDFDALMRDPNHPSRLSPRFASEDHLHPNDAGYQTMAGAIDLALFQ